MPTLKNLINQARTLCHADIASKKRLLELAAEQIHLDRQALSTDTLLVNLIAREKLGSTGLGDGIAIPHCRIDEATEPVGMLLTLEQGIDFDAPDGKPVDIVFVLLVPKEGHKEHLEVLAGLAGLFQQPEFCTALRSAASNKELYLSAISFAEQGRDG